MDRRYDLDERPCQAVVNQLTMTLLVLSFFAGVLTILAPCVLPMLPVIIGSSVGTGNWRKPLVVIGSLALSILLFTYLLRASTALIDIPPAFWSWFSGGIIVAVGLFFLFPQIWERLSLVNSANTTAHKAMGGGHARDDFRGDMLVGAALGPVFSSCSPTYFLILATVLPADFLTGTVYLLAYIFGLVLVLGLIALLGQRFTQHLTWMADSRGWFKRSLGAVFILVGVFIISGLDKQLQSWVLDSERFDISQFEQRLLDSATGEENDFRSLDEALERGTDPDVSIPRHLRQLFPDTDWQRVDPAIEQALSGGPTRDGIPAIDDPEFVPLDEFQHSGDTQAMVMIGAEEVRVYPYNILIWHEIVNDTIDGTPVAVTFCPLCGSAIAFDRTLPDGTVGTFGVSGSLLESNMIMFDRQTENLWQQSTGRSLAGSFHPAQLELVEFQLLTIDQIRATHPDARIMSERTGHRRDYGRNPYVGYDDDDAFFIFRPSTIDTSFPSKEIMVIFRTVDDIPVAVAWNALREAGSVTEMIGDREYTLTVQDSGELTISDGDTSHPFYFEMWFSFAVQHEGEEVHVIDL